MDVSFSQVEVSRNRQDELLSSKIPDLGGYNFRDEIEVSEAGLGAKFLDMVSSHNKSFLV